MLLSRRDASRIERWARCASKRNCRPVHSMARSLVMLPILVQVLLGHDFIRPLCFGSSAPVHPQIMPPCAQAPSPNVAYLSPPQAIGPIRGRNEPPTTVVGKHSTHSHDTGKPEENAAQLVALNERRLPSPAQKRDESQGTRLHGQVPTIQTPCRY